MAQDAEVIADELQFVVGALVRQMRSVSPARDTSLSQVSILKRLDRDGPHTVAELARLDALAGRGLVRRVADPGDLRRKLLVITGDGTQLLAERREAGLGNLASAIGDRLSDAERTRLSQALPLMRRLLD
jgi:DNA-binding MarR family transcriptional regulator